MAFGVEATARNHAAAKPAHPPIGAPEAGEIAPPEGKIETVGGANAGCPKS